MARRPKGVQSAVIIDKTDAIIKAGVGILYSVNLSWSGATVGDTVVIYDHASAASGTKLFSFYLPTTAGSFASSFPEVGKEALLGMFIDFTITGGTIHVDVGFD